MVYLLVTQKKSPTRLPVEFSKQTLQDRRDWQETFKVMKNKDLQPKLLLPAKLSFGIIGQIKSLPHKKNLKESISIKSMLYETLKHLL